MPTTNCYPEGNRKNFIMVQIDVEKNEIVELPPQKFGDLWLRFQEGYFTKNSNFSIR